MEEEHRRIKGDPRTTEEKKAEFLLAFYEHESIPRAADAINLGRYAHGEWLRNDPLYRERFQDCVRMLKQKWMNEVLAIARDTDARAHDRIFGYTVAINNVEAAQIDAHIPPAVQIFLNKVAMLGVVSPKLLSGPEPEGGVPCLPEG